MMFYLLILMKRAAPASKRGSAAGERHDQHEALVDTATFTLSISISMGIMQVDDLVVWGGQDEPQKYTHMAAA